MEYLLTNENSDMRLDFFVSDNIDSISRNYAQKLIINNFVKVNDKIVNKKNHILKIDDNVLITVPKLEILSLDAEDINIDIVYEDESLVVVNKPKGMVVHPAPGHAAGTLVNALIYRIKSLSAINGVIRPGIVHRIDKDTSGLLVIAKNDFAHNFLSKELKERKALRQYYALVNGNKISEKGKIDLPIGRDEKDRKKMAVTLKNSKNAVTFYEVIKKYEKYTLLKIDLETGRTHQIRVHLSYIGFPIVGDTVYGRKKNEFNVNGQLLHAKKLGFLHPEIKEIMNFECDLPDDFLRVLSELEGGEKNDN